MELQQLLSETAQRKASDLHLKSGSKPILRIHGHLEVQDDMPLVTREFIDKMAESLLGERRLNMLMEGREMDLGYMLPGIGRFRCNLFLAMGEVRGVFRHVPERIPAFQELHLPKVLERLSMERRGMILVTGITGSGKSTSLASMIDFMNRGRNDHIVTIEDPIEFVHQDHPAALHREPLQDLGQVQLVEGGDALRHVPEDAAHLAHREEQVAAEAADPGQHVAQVHLPALHQHVEPALTEQALGHQVDELAGDLREVVLDLQVTMDPEDRLRARLQVQVRRLALRRFRQQLLQFHGLPAPTWPPSPVPAATPPQPA